MDALPTLSAYRAASKLTLEEAGARLGVNKTTFMRWETGRVPAERVLEAERVTGVPRHMLRPDLYPAPATGVPVASAPHPEGAQP